MKRERERERIKKASNFFFFLGIQGVGFSPLVSEYSSQTAQGWDSRTWLAAS